MHLKVSFVQFAPVLGKPAQTLEKVILLLSKARGADLIVLPELANSGYNFISAKQAYDLSEAPLKSNFVDYLAGYASQNNATIVTGFNERDGKQIYNTSLLITPAGLAGKYRKIHLFMKEKTLFNAGDIGLPVFDAGFGKLGMQICFDYLFPETWRILGLKGADIICHPSNLVTLYAHKVMPAHAIVNRYFIVTANRIGTEGDLTFSGRSVITSPEGNMILEGDALSETVMMAQIDLELARNKMITTYNHVFNDRITKHYKDLGV